MRRQKHKLNKLFLAQIKLIFSWLHSKIRSTRFFIEDECVCVFTNRKESDSFNPVKKTPYMVFWNISIKQIIHTDGCVWASLSFLFLVQFIAIYCNVQLNATEQNAIFHIFLLDVLSKYVFNFFYFTFIMFAIVLFYLQFRRAVFILL